jgi:hypothetical protein
MKIDRRCREESTHPISGWRQENGRWLCPEAGWSMALPCPAGRPDALGGPWCAQHGGLLRALAEAERDWNWLAPEIVGGPDDVMDAGSLGLQTVHVYIVLRPERGRWLAWLGLGGMLEQVPRLEYAGCGRKACRNCARGKYCGKRQHAFFDRETALRDATTVWRERLAERIVEIRHARGGTLAWGIEVAPRADPIVLEITEGENAWDVAHSRIEAT